jgi:hypothetical protein
MNSNRETARIVGVLFIAATVTAILGMGILGSTLDAPDYLVNISEHENQVIMAVIFELILAVSVLDIGAMMFPVLREHIESLALGYAAIRLTEAIFIMVASVSLLWLLTLSQEYAAGATDAAYYQASGALLLALRDWAFVFGTLVFLGLGGLSLYYTLYRSRLVPRWLSGWGLIGATLIFLTGLLGFFGLSPESTTTTILAAPIALQEMVFAVWLIAKGFNPSANAKEKPSPKLELRAAK